MSIASFSQSFFYIRVLTSRKNSRLRRNTDLTYIPNPTSKKKRNTTGYNKDVLYNFPLIMHVEITPRRRRFKGCIDENELNAKLDIEGARALPHHEQQPLIPLTFRKLLYIPHEP